MTEGERREAEGARRFGGINAVSTSGDSVYECLRAGMNGGVSEGRYLCEPSEGHQSKSEVTTHWQSSAPAVVALLHSLHWGVSGFRGGEMATGHWVGRPEEGAFVCGEAKKKHE